MWADLIVIIFILFVWRCLINSHSSLLAEKTDLNLKSKLGHFVMCSALLASGIFLRFQRKSSKFCSGNFQPENDS
jgi:hypothetical protein